MIYKTPQRLSFLILSFFSLLFCAVGFCADKPVSRGNRESAPLNRPQYANWELIADSDFVVVGQLSVPANSIRESLRTKNHRYIEINLKPERIIKGTKAGQSIKVKFYTQPTDYSPSPNKILELNGQKVLVFLSVAGDVDEDDKFSASGIYFASYTPLALQRYDREIVDKVSREVENQQRIAHRFQTSHAGLPDKFHARVADLIEQALKPETQTEAFDKILHLGPAAVPSIIQLMDDRRRLPLPQMSVEIRNPNAFESIAHYSPKVMVDALSMLLKQLAHESFGQINNGGSEQERTRVVRAWRVYLYYKNVDSKIR